MAFCVMIRDVGEDPLSPALRDIQRERGARTALDTRWLRLLCLVWLCRGEALKVKNFLYEYLQETSVTRRQFLNQV